jgi:hypothetical protein
VVHPVLGNVFSAAQLDRVGIGYRIFVVSAASLFVALIVIGAIA